MEREYHSCGMERGDGSRRITKMVLFFLEKGKSVTPYKILPLPVGC